MAVISRMALKLLRNNKRRSITMILAVFLSSFLMFGIFTVGITYFKMQRLQNIRLSGAEFDAIMYGVTDRQKELLEEHPDVGGFGICAVSGSVEETPYDKTPDVGLMYADETYWKQMMAPARERVTGSYPVREDEVMVTEEALEKCGFQGLGIGDAFTVTCSVKGELREQTFRISGIWDGYGAKSVFYVSESYYSQTGLTHADVSSGRCYIRLEKKLMRTKDQDALITYMELNKAQRLFFETETGYSVQIFTGIVCLILVICLCAYLLIYNIMYLSVAGNIRYYGLLQTIGMTGRQIYGLIRRQMLLVGGTGILGGILFGSGLSFVLIPEIVKSLGIRAGKIGGIEVSFHPAVFLLTILFIGATVAAASRKPVRTAVMSSPMEALGYRPESKIRAVRKKKRGSLIWRMAGEQITKDKKKSAVTIVSLAVSLAVFLCVVTLVSTQGAREYYFNYRNLDMVLKNDTMKKEDLKEHVQIFNEDFLVRLNEMEGIAKIDPVIYTEITVPWEPDFADQWMREFYETWMNIPYEDEREEYKEHPENFGSVLAGIDEEDFKALNSTLQEPVSEAAFLKGETCLLYRNGLAFEDRDVVGRTVTCADYEDAEHSRSFEIAGMTDVSDYNALASYPPVIIVSDNVVKEFAEDPVIFRIGITYTEEYDEETEKAVLWAADGIPHGKDYSYESKIELVKTVKKAQGSMMEAGISMVLILAFIGIMNYLNTSVGSIQNRRMELSVLESIGMTGKQMGRMLVTEGLLYAAGAWLVTMTAGLGVTYWLYQSMNYNGAEFKIPILPLLAALVLTLAVCMSVPLITWQQMEKNNSIVDRIKGIE